MFLMSFKMKQSYIQFACFTLFLRIYSKFLNTFHVNNVSKIIIPEFSTKSSKCKRFLLNSIISFYCFVVRLLSFTDIFQCCNIMWKHAISRYSSDFDICQKNRVVLSQCNIFVDNIREYRDLIRTFFSS